MLLQLMMDWVAPITTLPWGHLCWIAKL